MGPPYVKFNERTERIDFLDGGEAHGWWGCVVGGVGGVLGDA